MDAQDYAGLREQLGDDVMAKWLQKQSEARVESDPAFYATDKDFQKSYPALAEYLTIRKLDDGSVRAGASLLVFAEDGVFKACLNDRAEDRTLWCSGDSFGDLLEALEAMLQSGSPQWRKSTKKQSKK